VSRTRVRTTGVVGPGRVDYYSGSTLYDHKDGSLLKSTSTSIDSTGSKDIDNPLAITHVRHNVVPMNGQSTNGSFKNRFYGYVDSSFLFAVWGSHLTTSIPSDGALASTLLARTNPSRAVVSLPTFIGELKDLPGMVRDAGRLVINFANKSPRQFVSRYGRIRNVGATYLYFQFGLLPFIRDVEKMLDFQNLTSQRVKELQRLYSSSGLKRRMNLAESSAQAHGSGTYTIGNFNNLTYRTSKYTKTKAWGTVRWKPTAPLPGFRDSAQLRRKAFELVSGLNPSAPLLTAWELLPWSWMADWFLGVQNFLEAHNNQVPAIATHVNIMKQTTTTYSVARVDSQPVTGGTCNSQLESKGRSQPAAFLNTNLPFLSGKQLSILGALAVQRIGR
jgi:hypothetical protein